jgi:hypothetical protein
MIVAQQRGSVGHVEVNEALAVEIVKKRAVALAGIERPAEIRMQPHRR